MKPLDRTPLQWLVQGPGRTLLTSLAAERHDPLELSRRLRRLHSPEEVRLVLEQLDLRRRARAKFKEADRLLFTARALEQATDERLARHKAQRFASQELVIDGCCGIGGDLMALARRGPVVGVDRDERVAYLAQANLEAIGVSPSVARVEATELTVDSFPPTAAVHIDPDRRPGDRRTIHLEAHEPNDTFLSQLHSRHPQLAIKLAPATDVNHPLLRDAELEWLGHSGQCQQLVAWYGSLTEKPGQRSASIVADDRTFTWSSASWPDVEMTGTPEAYLYEPHAALLASGLAGSLAAHYHLRGLTAGGGYLTGAAQNLQPWAEAFELLDCLPFRPERVKKWLHSRSIGSVEVKKRGVEANPAELQRQWSGPGTESAVVILTRSGPRTIALLCRRIRDVTEVTHPD